MRTLALSLTVLLSVVVGQKPSPIVIPKNDPSEAFFAKGMIPRLELTLLQADVARIRETPREYVRATMVENGKTTYASVGVKLKGAAGSFRPFDEKPALTIRMDKFDGGETFHGLNKFHLNNSVQDGTYLHEWLGSYLFRLAKIPASRVTHARVVINGRDLGLFVLKEGFDESFLARNQRDSLGNLYDGGFCQDIDKRLNPNAHGQKNDRADLKQLHVAVTETDLAERWRKTVELVDVNEFVSFVAMEL
jgi:spore coat protein CotH